MRRVSLPSPIVALTSQDDRYQGVGDTIVPLFRFRASVVIAPLAPLQSGISKKRNFREDTMAQFTQRSAADAAPATVVEGHLELFGFERSLTNMKEAIASITRQTGIEKTAVRDFRLKFQNVEFAELRKRIICWLP